MNHKEIITIEKFWDTLEEVVNEIKREYPNLYLDYAGIIPVNDVDFRYDSSPINTKIFATTGGDGVHYSILKLTDLVHTNSKLYCAGGR